MEHVKYCKLGVYDVEEEKPVIKNPNNCVVFCRGCEDICLVGAITHQSEEETEKIISTLKKEQSK